ncbi:response regulator transcription factor [Streptomyces phaeochromogenes]|uniref:LuxR C-terminal-related transcriptional regulator n=1 Tax=Streptomyces phaeochromogenes TaxID=1923 RepID=UPI00386C16AF|nr:response regulator transcription factor [Streptomyces phaeochromogenes]
MAVLACPVVKVMIVDGEELLRSGLSHILDSVPDLRVVGVCQGIQAAQKAGELRPEVECPILLRAAPEPPEVVMFTTLDLHAYLARVMSDGPEGFLLKDTEPRALIQAVRAAGTGGRCLPAPHVRPESGTPSSTDTGKARALAALSAREREVLALLVKGLSNAAIARRLYLATSTVKEYVSSILKKLDVENRVQAAVLVAQTSPTEAGETGT